MQGCGPPGTEFDTPGVDNILEGRSLVGIVWKATDQIPDVITQHLLLNITKRLVPVLDSVWSAAVFYSR